MPYFIQYAKSDRSNCKGPKKSCPSSTRNIEKGELRVGVDVDTIHGTVWRHWCCTTPKVFDNMRSSHSDPSELEGWEDLREEDKERVERAWENGEIAENEKSEPAAEHSDPSAKRKAKADLPPTNEIADEREKNESNKKSKTKATKGKSDNGSTSTKQKEEKKKSKATTSKKDIMEEENTKSEPVQDTVIKRDRKKVPEEPKVASYASRKKTSQKTATEPTRRSARVAAIKKEEE